MLSIWGHTMQQTTWSDIRVEQEKVKLGGGIATGQLHGDTNEIDRAIARYKIALGALQVSTEDIEAYLQEVLQKYNIQP